ncbi:MAG TPA: Rne/Rng family ribonuclease [Candidatus Kapabacteria bacterium]|nr:Rne/Rng family ribonuclease [Candidatus Kapabacteria bacterium]
MPGEDAAPREERDGDRDQGPIDGGDEAGAGDEGSSEGGAESGSDAERRKRAGRRGGRNRRGGRGGGGTSGPRTMDAKLPTFQTKRSGEVTINLERNQDIIVQVTRESYSQKGVRVSTKVSLPGRFLVLLPLDGSIGVSRKVQSTKERRRLRRVAKSILPEGYGCIIRTNAQGKESDLIRQDLVKLIDNWRTIEEKLKTNPGPGLLYRDQSVANTVMRDLFTPDITRVVIDNKNIYRQIRDYVEWAAPTFAEKVELFDGDVPIFDRYGVEHELEKMFQRRIYLPSGGYIILDQTEAMMVIDVNSGRFADKSEQEITSLRTNIESAREIARQIRLRDIGGLLVVDFIDLYHEANRKKVYDELKKEMRRDRAKSVVLPMTQFGLVQMTRQRVRQQVLATISEPCPTCEGSGMVQSKSTVVRQIERWLQRFRSTCKEFRLMLRAHPSILDFLTEEGDDGVSRLAKLMMRNFVRIKVVPDESLPVDAYHFVSVRHQTDITDKYAA